METTILTTTFEGIKAIGAAVRVSEARDGGDGRRADVVARALDASGFKDAGRQRTATVEPVRPGNDELYRLPRALGVLAAAGVLREEEIEGTLCAGLLGADGRWGERAGSTPLPSSPARTACG